MRSLGEAWQALAVAPRGYVRLFGLMLRLVPPHRPSLLAALALMLALAPATAFAARESTLAWPGAAVVAGQIVTLSWGELPAGVGEMEILLSLDDGRTYAVRVSPELDGRERSFRWRVPNLPTARARLRMRLGDARAEIETEATAPFRIVGSEAAPAPRHLVLERPLWTGFEPLGSCDREVLSPVAHMDAADPWTAAVVPPARPLALRPAAASPVPGSAAVASTPATRPTPATRHSRLTPLRN